MKTYTIRPLEWQYTRDDMHQAETIAGLAYIVSESFSGTFSVLFDAGDKLTTVHTGIDTEAAAKELAWQDWLRRITPALEECK